MRQRQHEERKKVSRERAGAFTYFILSAVFIDAGVHRLRAGPGLLQL